MPKAIIVCAILAQYRVGSLKKAKILGIDFYGLIVYPQEVIS